MTQPLTWSMRFALALAAVFVIGTLCAGGLSYVFLSKEMTQRLAADVRASTESLARIADTGGRRDLLEQITAQTRANRDGATLYAFIDAQTGAVTGSDRLGQPFEGARRLIVGHDIAPGDSALVDASDAYQAFGIRTGLGWVITARDEAWVAESGEILIQTTAWSLGFATLLSFALALAIAQRTERRIERMKRVLRAVGHGQWNRRIRDTGSDDLAELSHSVDQMLDQLEAGIDSLRQVSTDVAHDLRAPLSRLRMRLEPQVLSADVPERTRHEIGSALVDIDAISTSFDAILRLARLQSGSVERRRDPVDLVALARSAQDLLAATAEDAGHVLRLDCPDDPVMIVGDEDLLLQALSNLLANAVDHCPAPVTITVRVTRADGSPTLAVSDTGPGIPLADRQRVLDRFVRLDASRSVPGTGLGLSLVAAIAALHGADLSLTDTAPGLAVSLRFPPATA